MLLMLPFIFSPFARQFVFIRNRQVWNNLAFEALHLFRDRFNGRSAPTASGLDKSVALDVTGPDEDVVDTLGSPRYDICGPHGENVEFPPR